MSEPQLDPLAGCRAYLEAHHRQTPLPNRPTLPIVTFSREAGAGAVTVGTLVAQLLNSERAASTPPWTVFDKNLVARVLEDHQLPETLNRFLPEDARPGVTGAVEEMLGLHPSAWRMAEHTTDTILRLAALGNAILVGRGSTFITARVQPALHVRLVAPVEVRVAHLAEYHHLTHDEAVTYAKKADLGRRRYVKRYFSTDVENPLHYTLVLNTGRLDYAFAARVIVAALHACVERFANK